MAGTNTIAADAGSGSLPLSELQTSQVLIGVGALAAAALVVGGAVIARSIATRTRRTVVALSARATGAPTSTVAPIASEEMSAVMPVPVVPGVPPPTFTARSQPDLIVEEVMAGEDGAM